MQKTERGNMFNQKQGDKPNTKNQTTQTEVDVLYDKSLEIVENFV